MGYTALQIFWASWPGLDHKIIKVTILTLKSCLKYPYMLRFFQRAKKLFPSISVGSINLLTEMGIFNGTLWPLPLQVKLTLRSGCAVKSVVHSMLTICWNCAPASTVESTVLTCSCTQLVNSGPNVTLGWKFCNTKHSKL